MTWNKFMERALKGQKINEDNSSQIESLKKKREQARDFMGQTNDKDSRKRMYDKIQAINKQIKNLQKNEEISDELKIIIGESILNESRESLKAHMVKAAKDIAALNKKIKELSR